MMVLLGIVGFFVGAIVGALLGVGLGLASVTIFRVSSFEGGAGMLVYLVFLPIGAILGALIGLAGFLIMGARRTAKPPGPQ
jgi:hypothetical protein